MCILCLWLRHFHVHWRISFVCRRYEGYIILDLDEHNEISTAFSTQIFCGCDLMQVFQRERMNGHYGVSAFVISNTLSAMPYLIMITFISGTICYFMVRLHPGFIHYLFFVLCLYASVTVVESLMMAIASVVPNFLMGIIIGAGIQVTIQIICM